jgi:PAS domain S-box-containing protein
LPGLVATVLTTLGAWFFLTDPPNSFYIADKAEAESLAVYAISATAISLLGGQVHATLLSKTRSEEAARQSESLVRALLDSSAQAILAVNIDGKIVTENAATETMFGYKREELLYQPLDLLISEEVESPHRAHLKRYLANPVERSMGAGLDIIARHKSGATIPVEVGLSHIDTALGTLAIAFMTDITQRRVAEAERQKFVSLADSSLDFIGMCDMNFMPFYVNQAGLELVGLDSLEQALRTPVPQFFFPEDQRFISEEVFPRVIRDGRAEMEIRFRHFKTGQPIWMIYNVFYIKDAAGLTVGLATVSRDVTERKRAEEALRESEQRLRLATEAAKIGAFDWNIQTGVNVWTPKLEAMYGLAPGEFGRTQPAWEQLVHPCDRAGAVAKVEETLATGEPAEHEWRVLWPDGSVHWISGFFQAFKDATGKPLRMTGVNIDITARKSAEEALRGLAEARGMERFRLSFEEAPVGMALIGGDGVWLRVNHALCEMTGYTENELISSGRDLTHPGDRAEESRLFSRILSGELAAASVEERYLHKQGHTIYVLLSIAVVERDEAGRPVHFVAHVQDLTDRKRVEQELEASRAQMVSHSRLSALGMMAGGIAHEINNPLGIIHASSENLLRMAESGPVPIQDLLKNCNRISLTADRIAKIVRSLRRIAREGSADRFREAPVREIVDETLGLCAERFRAHNIRLIVPALIPAAVISCREAQICQVLLNLLQNAYDELVDREGDRWVQLDVTLCHPWVVFSVRDSGPGVAPETRAHIMEPFFTTKPVGKGTGLGLSISRSIALEHGGTLELELESVHTCFVLKLPLSGEPNRGVPMELRRR